MKANDMNIDSILTSHGIYDVDGVPYAQAKRAVFDAVSQERERSRKLFNEHLDGMKQDIENSLNEAAFEGMSKGIEYMYNILNAASEESGDEGIRKLIEVIKPATDVAVEDRRKELGL